MAENYFPFDAGPGSNINEQQWRYLAMAVGVGIGVVPNQLNELAVTADSSGRHIFVDTGRAGCFGHYYENTSSLQLDVGANATGANRVDAVVVTFNFGGNAIHASILPGTAAAPNVVQDLATQWQLVIGYVIVPPTATTIRPQDAFACLDRFGVGSESASPIGTILETGISFTGPHGGVPQGFIACDGDQYSPWQLPKLCGMQKVNGVAGVQLVPDKGPVFDYGLAFGIFYAPDHRDRFAIGANNMGTPQGIQGQGIDASYGEVGGSVHQTIAQMAQHHHHPASDQRFVIASTAVTNISPVIQAGGHYSRDDLGDTITSEAGSGDPFFPPFAGVNKMMKVA